MIVLLGLPKTASSWLYKNLKAQLKGNLDRNKEPHIFDTKHYFSQ